MAMWRKAIKRGVCHPMGQNLEVVWTQFTTYKCICTTYNCKFKTYKCIFTIYMCKFSIYKCKII